MNMYFTVEISIKYHQMNLLLFRSMLFEGFVATRVIFYRMYYKYNQILLKYRLSKKKMFFEGGHHLFIVKLNVRILSRVKKYTHIS